MLVMIFNCLCAFVRYCNYLGTLNLTTNLLRKETNYLTFSIDMRRTVMDYNLLS